ncbi:Na(+)/H(+) antiporter subunit C [Pseudonocardia sp. RS010]|uniref:Na(+)/H(+) antiporter subunit C n=1 Tax=Pseudonocardia sp. RS010 TaxID=3385979 RepID=UPI0039A2547A
MTINLTMAIVVAVLYSVGFFLLLQRSLMRILIGIIVLGHGTNLLLQLAGGPPGRAPVLGGAPPAAFADPLPQALALTAIVITFALTTFLLALAYRSWVLAGHDEVQDDPEDRRIATRREPRGSMEADTGEPGTGDPGEVGPDPAEGSARRDDPAGGRDEAGRRDEGLGGADPADEQGNGR